MTWEFNLGDEVRDTITGLEGIVVARIEYLNGCKQYEVQPEGVQDNGKIKKHSWIDEPQLKLINSNNEYEQKEEFGGIREHPE